MTQKEHSIAEGTLERLQVAQTEIRAEYLAPHADPIFRLQARRILVVNYFLPSEEVALAESLGIPESELGAAASAIDTDDRNSAVQRGRDAKFRLVVVSAYSFTCCLTRHRLTTISRGSMVDAAHIHPFADSRNNDPRNGIAL